LTVQAATARMPGTRCPDDVDIGGDICVEDI
jgi:hypothetical protein